MSLHRWLHNFRSPARRGSKRAPTHRPGLEVLEGRLTPSFSPATSFPVGAGPQAVVAADFNNDGRLDLATANPAPGTVSVLLGDGRGGFGAAIDSILGSVVGATQASFTVADFDNDGKLDLAALASYTNEFGEYYGWVSVLLGNGDGSFRAPTLTAGNLAVAAGDFNNDGNSDLVVSEVDFAIGEVGTGVRVLPGDGRGGFTWTPGATLIGLGQYPTVIAVADLNRDGNLDAVTAAPLWDGQFGSGSFVLLGNGDGTFRYDFFEFSGGFNDQGGVAVGDLTGDGIPDLITADWSVYVMVGRGDGTFDNSLSYAANGNMHTAVAVADFDGDGRLDTVTCDGDTGTVSELLGNGVGTLTYAGAYAVGSSPTAIAVGDFNDDGRPDVATADGAANTVSVLLNDGTWTPPPPPPPTIRINDVTVKEGNTGTVSATFAVTLSARSTETITVAYATGNGTATAGSDYQAASGNLTFAPGDIRKTITVLVKGDRVGEPNETFVVNLSCPTHATIGDGQGVGTVLDDEPRVSIDSLYAYEGKKGRSTFFTFTLTLSAAYDQAVTMSFRTADGTATASSGDYIAKTGTVTFAPGETTRTITIEVKGDNQREPNEYFFLDLFNNTNSLFTGYRAIGWIMNDD
jgi:hypothetical protein